MPYYAPPIFPGPVTTVTAGTTPTLARAAMQRVLVPTDTTASGFLFPAAPADKDAVWVHTTGAGVANAATLNPNGAHIEDPLNPGTIGTVTVTMGPNPGASAIFVFDGAATTWRLWQ